MPHVTLVQFPLDKQYVFDINLVARAIRNQFQELVGRGSAKARTANPPITAYSTFLVSSKSIISNNARTTGFCIYDFDTLVREIAVSML